MRRTQTNSFESLPFGGKIGLLGLILILVSVIYMMAFHLPLDADIKGAKSRYKNAQQDLKGAESKQREYLMLQQEISRREGRDRDFKRVLPVKAEMPVFLESLNQTAELSGLRIERIEPRPEESTDLFVRIPVSIQLQGRFLQLAKFFYNISQLQRAINMEDIRLESPQINESDEVELKVSVRATTFRQPDLPEAQR